MLLRTMAVAAIAMMLPALPAKANGRFPEASQFVVSPGNPSAWVLRTTFGLVLSRDAGSHWDWACEKAVGYSGLQDPAIAVVSNDTILAGLFTGVSTAPAPWCNWSFAPGGIENKVIIDVSTRPNVPSSAVALTSHYVSETEAGSLFFNQVFETLDHGATWSNLGVSLPSTFISETVEVAKSDPARLYVSGTRLTAAGYAGVLHTSRNSGASWDETLISLSGAEKAPFVSGVDPKNADIVYLRTSGDVNNRLLISTDGGRTLRDAYRSEGPLRGFALSSDGATVFVGGPKDGLLTATRDNLQFQKVRDLEVQCLTWLGTDLFACSSEASGFELGVSSDQGKTFTTKLHFSDIRGPIACDADASSQACAADWPAMRDRLVAPPGAEPESDAGTAPPAPGGGCHCQHVSPHASLWQRSWWHGLFVSLLALLWARRRVKRSA